MRGTSEWFPWDRDLLLSGPALVSQIILVIQDIRLRHHPQQPSPRPWLTVPYFYPVTTRENGQA